jgi:hypothetical protein
MSLPYSVCAFTLIFRLMKSPCCLCLPIVSRQRAICVCPNFSFYMQSVSYERKVGN